jgi:hypothetical protein
MSRFRKPAGANSPRGGDGVEEREVGWIEQAQGAEAAAVLDDGATDGIEELRAGGLVFDRGQGLEVGLVGALGQL